jgi:hypothetical protein
MLAVGSECSSLYGCATGVLPHLAHFMFTSVSITPRVKAGLTRRDTSDGWLLPVFSIAIYRDMVLHNMCLTVTSRILKLEIFVFLLL